MSTTTSLIVGVPDAWMLVVAAALPLAGALFALVMPGADRLALRYVGMGTCVAAGVAGIIAVYDAWRAPLALDVAGVPLSLDALSAPFLLSLLIAAPIALRSGAPRIFGRTQFYVVTVLFAEGLLAAALVVDAPLIRIAAGTIATVPLFALVALFGGPQRGTTTMSAVMIWIFADVAALSVIAWLAARAGVPATQASVDDLATAAASLPSPFVPWVFLVLAAPGLVRLAAGPFSVWLASFLDEAPVSAAILAACGTAPLGAQIVARIAVPACPAGLLLVLPWVAGLGALSVVLSGVIAIGERDLRKLLAQLLQAAGATAATALLCLDDGAIAAASMHVVVTGAAASLALTSIEAIERRYETRDAVELAGLAQSTQLLAVFLIFGLLALVGIPFLGAGTTLWAAAAAVASSPGLVAAGAPAWWALAVAVALAAGTMLASAGVVGAARRLLSPPPKKSKRLAPLEVLTVGQALRLFVPGVVAVVAGVAARAFIDDALVIARELGGAARARAGVVAESAEPFSTAPMSPAPYHSTPSEEDIGAPSDPSPSPSPPSSPSSPSSPTGEEGRSAPADPSSSSSSSLSGRSAPADPSSSSSSSPPERASPSPTGALERGAPAVRLAFWSDAAGSGVRAELEDDAAANAGAVRADTAGSGGPR